MATDNSPYFISKQPLVRITGQVQYLPTGNVHYEITDTVHYHVGSQCKPSSHNSGCAGLGSEVSCVPGMITGTLVPGMGNKPVTFTKIPGFICSHHKRVKL
ncbi:hypothetical protein LJR290_007638 [Variovorax sp. LjRoot290]|uniref:hypothetical protein n=1 Tax=Variovorax sp. LjRoot290 TaxID=3342316 RepID=UPI003ED0415C